MDWLWLEIAADFVAGAYLVGRSPQVASSFAGARRLRVRQQPVFWRAMGFVFILLGVGTLIVGH